MNSATKQPRITRRLRLAGLCGVMLFAWAGPLWAPPSPGWCKNNTFLTPVSNLSFGTFSSNTTGVVNVNVNGIRTFTGDIILLGGTVSQAVLNISGCPNYLYSIIIPPDSVLTNGANTMALTTFTSFPVGSGVLDVNGAGVLQFGASLTVGYPQLGGPYTGTYTVEIIVQ
ncbi:MAG: DUF4402 domain-containing protein [Gammaproteobacteria bacterium]|nr:DUF4402 domain-containing protein [Gammaproteobacteria bacterium]MDH5651621.1 DUF4402 domain-containing protein [Gammaproteobacteria bacterium]